MKILVAHNAYQQRGGEDAVVADEIALMRSRGHDVELLSAHNDEIPQMGRLELLGRVAWSRSAALEMKERCSAFRPDVVHVHNSFPLLSPSIHWAAAEAGVPVVQTLHNFRLLCPQAMLLRRGKVCEDCVGKVPWRGAVRGCYRGSVIQSTAVAGMLMLHRGMGTWHRKVNTFIALNSFCRDKFIEGGIPANRLVIKPNFVDLPPPNPAQRSGFLFVGRLSEEKGLAVLAAAAAKANAMVDVLGVGPMESELAGHPNLRLLGNQSMPQVLARMNSAQALVLPSIWYENFPRTLVEAWACALPVIASRLGAMPALIVEGETGMLFDAGGVDDLARCMSWARHHPSEMMQMGQQARVLYEAEFGAECNYSQLIKIYTNAVAEGTLDS